MDHHSPKTHRVSIIIPCRNEERYIPNCLDSILANSYPKELLEILVIDGASEDRSRQIVSNYAEQHPCVRLIENPARITPAAMNLGIKSSTGSIIVINSAHSEYPPNFISRCVDWLEKTGADVVGGPLKTVPGAQNCVANAIASASSHPFGVGNSKFRTSLNDGYVDTVPFGAYRRSVFDRVGLFDERLKRNQDNELCSRILQSGGKIFMTRELLACYYSRATIRGLMTQAFGNGVWNVSTIRITPAAFRWRHFTPFLFVGALGALGLGSVVLPFCRPLVLALLALYFVAALVASLHVAVKSGLRRAAILPAIFFALHTAYGTGTWVGLARLLAHKSDRGTGVEATGHVLRAGTPEYQGRSNDSSPKTSVSSRRASPEPKEPSLGEVAP